MRAARHKDAPDLNTRSSGADRNRQPEQGGEAADETATIRGSRNHQNDQFQDGSSSNRPCADALINLGHLEGSNQ